MTENCPLCRFELLTKKYHEDDTVIVVDCKQCHVPMFVLKRHARWPLLAELKHVQNLFDKLFPDKMWDDEMKSIPDHYHVHAR